MRLRSDWGRSEGRNWRGGENLGKWTENKRGRKMEEAKICKDIEILAQKNDQFVQGLKNGEIICLSHSTKG